jgi:hypothetical protein
MFHILVTCRIYSKLPALSLVYYLEIGKRDIPGGLPLYLYQMDLRTLSRVRQKVKIYVVFFKGLSLDSCCGQSSA